MNPRPPATSPDSDDERFVSESQYHEQEAIDDLKTGYADWERLLDDDWPYPDTDPAESPDL